MLAELRVLGIVMFAQQIKHNTTSKYIHTRTMKMLNDYVECST